MEKLKGYNEANVFTGLTQLPKGGYIAKILDCKECANERGYKWLEFSFDIAEGEHKDHFKNIWNADKSKKWKGRFNLFIPDETSIYYDKNLSKFKTAIVNIEESNSEYKWNWKEETLKGKLVGVLFGEKELETDNGDVITITECRGFRSVDCIREGSFRMPQLIELDNKPSQTQTTPQPTFEDINDDDLPF